MKPTILIGLLVLGVLWQSAQCCLECGQECKPLCGTKQFKACCFNYLKKRSVPPSGPDLKMEVSLVKPSSRRAFAASQYYSPYGSYLPLATFLSKQQDDRLSPSDQGSLQLMYDA